MQVTGIKNIDNQVSFAAQSKFPGDFFVRRKLFIMTVESVSAGQVDKRMLAVAKGEYTFFSVDGYAGPVTHFLT